MVRTASTMMQLGKLAPDFALPDVVSGSVIRRDDFLGKQGLLVVFMCNHCPYVKHIAAELARVGSEYMGKGVGIVGISSNDVTTHPDDGPELMKAEAETQGYTFPYLFDESQAVARAYQAACTPDFFLFDSQLKLVYRGQLDDTRPKQGATANGKDLRLALDCLLTGAPVLAQQKPSIGCNIKWKSGQEPDYFDPAGVG